MVASLSGWNGLPAACLVGQEFKRGSDGATIPIQPTVATTVQAQTLRPAAVKANPAQVSQHNHLYLYPWIY